jgi:PHD finger-like domain-containing protein 5A
VGKLCEKCDGKCVICDSYVRPATLVHVCDDCNYGSFQGRCVICGGPGVSDAYYCKECTQAEKDVSRGGWVGLGLPPKNHQPPPPPPPPSSLSHPRASLRLPLVLQRDGCPKIINLGQARTDMFYERKKYGFIKNG